MVSDDQLGSADTPLFDAHEANEALEITFGELRALEAKIAELKASEHKLRVENLSLRTRVEGLKSKRSFETKCQVALGFCLLLLFMVALGTTAIVFAF